MESTSKTPSDVNPFLRSCEKESPLPIDGENKGEIPKWLKGSLLRVGSGLLQIGPDHFRHLFDGMALIHRFSFKEGKVTYQNKFLRSDTYKANMKAQRIVVNEFGTPAVPDPCKTIFQRFISFFKIDQMTDNDLITVSLFADEVYACSETNAIWKIDPETLESLEKVKISDHLPINMAVAHPHEEPDGTVYNVGSTFTLQPYYRIMKFPPKDKESDSTFKKASVISSIPASKYFTLNYHHSFGMSENYFVFVEQPFFLSISKMVWAHFFTGGPPANALTWDESKPCIFHVVRKSDGKLMETIYHADSFFVFHHINTYEEDDHLVVDVCAYNKGKIINDLYIKALEDYAKNNPDAPNEFFDSKSRRYVLPLKFDDKKTDENLVTLKKTTATAKRSNDGIIKVTPEIITNEWFTELPRINYEKFNGKKYRYYYSIATKENFRKNCLLKGDVETKEALFWYEEGTIPSEPVFVPEPNATSEDSGVVLVSLLYESDQKKVSLLVLDAKTMKELGRSTFESKGTVPANFHGIFVNN